MKQHTHTLLLAHRKVDEEIRIEQKYRAADPLRLVRLKKRKLAMKDRIHQLIAPRPQERA